MDWTPSQKGAIAESAIAAHAIELGIGVYRPLVEGERYDLIFDMRPRLLRIQCKWATKRGSIIGIRVGTSTYTPRGYRLTTYTEDEIDAVVAYCRELRQSYFLPMSLVAGRSYIHLRLDPAKNRQTRRINFASDYELGAIAQLGERSAGSRKVAGSNPASSTRKAAHNGRLFS
jgi:hypothetical protein